MLQLDEAQLQLKSAEFSKPTTTRKRNPAASKDVTTAIDSTSSMDVATIITSTTTMDAGTAMEASNTINATVTGTATNSNTMATNE